ncbi:MAG: tetratricopeptide repeat protein [Magnetococcales bacterium]|nr:tetratricopeptide repeat protein [Magnetococcales bacterium]
MWTRIALQWGMERCDQEHLLFHQIGNTALLLVLDNAEDLIRPASANLKRFLRNFMRACPQLKILLSTRRWLGDPDGFKERQLTVERLAPPHDRDIFLAHVDVRLSEEEKQSDTVEQIVKLLEGHPRSLALVAGKAGGPFGLSEILHRLRTEASGAIMAEDLLGEDLTHTPDNLLRAKTLIHTMNLSYEPLLAAHPQTALFFCWLGLLPSGLPMDLVQPVFGDAGEKALRVLLRENLAETQNRGHRLTLPAPIRWYASRRLSEHDQQARALMFRQTLAAFERWIHQAHPLLGTPQSRLAVTLGSIEEANLRSLVDYFKLWREENTREEQLPPSARSLASTIRAWTQLSIYGDKTTSVLTIVTGCLQAIQNLDQEAEANTLQALGDLLVRTARLKEAEERYGQALKLFGAIEERLGEANTLKALGDLLVRTDRLKEAEERYGQALKQYGAIDARLGEANTLSGMGTLLLSRQQPEAAFNHFLQSLSIHRAIDNDLGSGGCHVYMARAARQASCHDRGIVLSSVALEMLAAIYDPYGQRLALMDMIPCLIEVQDGEGAHAALLLAWHLAKSIEDPSATGLESVCRDLMPGLDFTSLLSPKKVEELRARIAHSVAKARERMEHNGEDPYAPLTES